MQVTKLLFLNIESIWCSSKKAAVLNMNLDNLYTVACAKCEILQIKMHWQEVSLILPQHFITFLKPFV